MTGTLQIKRGIYHCVLSYKDEKGAWKQKWVSTGLEVKGNKRKAMEVLNSLVSEQKGKKECSNIVQKENPDLVSYHR